MRIATKLIFVFCMDIKTHQLFPLTALVISFLKDTQIFTVQCEINVYRSHLFPYDNMSYNDEGPFFPISDRGNPALIQD
jgi:hypothetical protein